MSTHVLNNMRLWRGGTDLSGKTNQLSIVLTTDALEDTGIDNTGARLYVPGLNGVTFSHRGRLDLGASSVEAALWAEQGLADQVMTIAAAASVGSRAYLFRGIPSTLEPGGAVGELYSFAVNAQGTGKVSRGVLLEPGAVARTASFDSTPTQLGATGASEYLHAALHVLSASAGDTLDVVVQSDNAEGFPSSTNRITFTQATTTGAEWKSLAGAITDDWYRISVTIGGAATSFLFVVSIGVGR